MFPRHLPVVLFVAALLLSQQAITPAATHDDIAGKKDKDDPPRPKPKPGPRGGGDDD